MDMVLTDDEIVAVALERRIAWPVPFPTVATDVDHLAAAAARGRRSLLVRGLATPSDSRVELSQPVIDTLDRAVSGRIVLAWVASLDEPTVFAGSSTLLSRRPDGDQLDLTSASGIHDFRATTPDAAEAIVVAIAKNVFDYGFAGTAIPTTRLFVGPFGGGPLALVSEGVLEVGEWTAAGIETGQTVTEWDPDLVVRTLR